MARFTCGFACTIKIFVPRHVASLLQTSTMWGSVRVTLCPCTYRVRSGDFPPTAAVKENTPSLPVEYIFKMNKQALQCKIGLFLDLVKVDCTAIEMRKGLLISGVGCSTLSTL